VTIPEIEKKFVKKSEKKTSSDEDVETNTSGSEEDETFFDKIGLTRLGKQNGVVKYGLPVLAA
jgi:hypothetical protein